MKAAICLLALALTASCANAGLLGFWRHDEASGSLIDATGQEPVGTPAGAPIYGMPGVPNGTYGAITVAGASGTSIEYGPHTEDDFFVLGADNINPILNLDATSAFTVMGWVNPIQPTLTLRTYRLLSTGSAAGADRGWGFGLRLPNIDGSAASVRFTTFGIADNDSSTFSVTFNSWIHLAATYNNGAINYYLNGTALDSDNSVFGNEGAPARLVVGGRLGGSDVDQMQGRIDGLQVYDELLTAGQIQQAAAGSVSIPEPASTLLLLIGGVALARHRR